MTDQILQRRIRVLIFPTEDRTFFTMPLGISACNSEPTIPKAVEEITQLINGHIMSCLGHNIPPNKIFGTAEPKFNEMYEQGRPYDYRASLLPDVRRLVSGIDYRLSNQVIDNDAFARYLKGEM